MFFNKETDGKGPPSVKRRTVPLLPLRDIIVFPHMVSQLFVGRERSINALDAAMARDKDIFLAAQKNAKTNEPTPDDIFRVGTLGTVMQLLRLPDGTVKVLVEGKRRARMKRFAQTDEFFLVEVEEIAEAWPRGVEVEALMRSVQAAFELYVKLNKKVQPEVLMSVQTIDDPARLSDTIVANLPTIKLVDRQQLLEMEEASKRLERLHELMQAEIEILQVEKKIRSRVKKQMEKTQKEYYLNEQMQAIQKELGGGERDEFKNEIQEIEETLKTKRMSKEASAKVKKELKKLKMMHPTSAEATVVRNYIDWIISLPWYDKSEETYDLEEGRRDPRGGSLRPEEDQRANRRIPRRAGADEEAQRAGALLRRASGRRQDEPREEHRAGDGAEVRAIVAGRRSRRGGDPRPSPDVHRRDAGQADSEPAQGGDEQPGVLARRGRQDVDRLPRRPGGGAPRGARSGAEPQLQRSLPRPRLRPFRRDVHHDGEYAQRHSDSSPGSHGDHPAIRDTRSSRS